MTQAETVDMDKYGKLLKPIKQLEEVWGIDLAATLQSYAAEVTAIDLGGQNLNFAQAALLIMGASAIYGKKVDSLQTLVQDTYDAILQRRKEKEEAQVKRRKRSRIHLRSSVKFIDESTTITKGSNLYRDDVPETLRMILSGNTDNIVGNKRGTASREAAKISEGELIPFENTQTGGFNFRVNICTISGEGLLLPNVRQELMGSAFELGQVTPRKSNTTYQMPATPSTATSKQILSESSKKGESEDLDEELKKAIEKDEREKLQSQQQETKVKEEEHSEPEPDSDSGDIHDDDDKDYDTFIQCCKQDRFAVTIQDRPWEKLDITEKIADIDPTKQMMADLTAEKLISHKQHQLRKLDNRGKLIWDDELLGKLGHTNTNYKDLQAYSETARETLKKGLLQEKHDRPSQSQGRESTFADGTEVEPPVAAVDSFHLRAVDAIMDDCIDADADVDDGGWSEHEPDTIYEARDSQMVVDNNQDMNIENPEVTYYVNKAKFDDLLMATNNTAEVEARLNGEEAALYQRVSKWQDRLEPLLEEQARRPAFNIGTYMERLLNVFSDDQKKITFQDLVSSCCSGTWEVSRFFLASLQLANTGNIRLEIKRLFNGAVSDEVTLHLITKVCVFNFEELEAEPEPTRARLNKKRKAGQ
eukprot:TRINITY_DN24627_c0_g1_i1.p1 TRINITY_DN24627_c0_g1~~TRINITY_DN24627_c0_g1_i1.p1  ORF type:complete len:646 (+),score=154.86 TRINITY_DN24627_c0_g1_i1:80-2017(+)